MRGFFLALALIAAPQIASACSVCYGGSGAPMAKATNSGIFVLLGVIGFVQAGFVAMFIAFWRRAKAFRAHRDSFHVIDGGMFR